tara:strand:- start:656 stop:1582 length:927 start_codon:yes stop_codon:yes gene_type:complete
MKLSKIQTIKPREIWKHEALDFTQWLAKEDNINILCETLDLNIENIKTESAAGRYNVDIVADDIDNNCKVIIENQLETTDHKHLGQLLTYASAFDASVIIWLVTDFTEEHRQAIDWFNRHISDSISFFLVQIQVIKIDDSSPAPLFNIISEPNNWGKSIKKSNSGDAISNTKLLQKDFWAELKDYAKNKSISINLGRTPRPQHWYNISFGSSRCHICLTMNTSKKYIGCEIYIRDDMNLYNIFYKNKESIESNIKSELIWKDLPNATASRIQTIYECNPEDRSQWNEYFEWCTNEIQKFADEFSKYIK